MSLSKIVKEGWSEDKRFQDEYTDFISVRTKKVHKERKYGCTKKIPLCVALVEKNVSGLTEHEFQDCKNLIIAAPEMLRMLQWLYENEKDADKATKIHAVLRAARGRK